MRKVSAFSCKTSEELLPSTLLLHSLAKFNATGEIYLNRVDGGRLLQLHFSTSYIIAAGYRVICLEQETEHLLTNDSLQLDYVATEWVEQVSYRRQRRGSNAKDEKMRWVSNAHIIMSLKSASQCTILSPKCLCCQGRLKLLRKRGRRRLLLRLRQSTQLSFPELSFRFENYKSGCFKLPKHDW